MNGTDKAVLPDSPDLKATKSRPAALESFLGCWPILAILAVTVAILFALRMDRPWFNGAVLLLCGLFVGFTLRTAFRKPERTAEGIVGGRPHDVPPPPDQVLRHLMKLDALGKGETVLAALDDSWTGNGTSGVVVTDRRILSFRKSGVRLDLALAEVKTLSVRKMWYPGAGFLGRGEFIGEGPVIVLRLSIRMADGTTERLRLRTYANEHYPFVKALLDQLGERVVVRRTFPGL